MLEKEFVPYALALKLKEYGFDEPCFGMYCEGRFHLLYPNSYKDIPEDFYREVDAPTFSQAFRWFREKYGLNSYIASRTTDAGRTIYIPNGRTIPDTTKNGFVVDNIIYSPRETYEEAELVCLEKLIEILENKKIDNETN